MIDLCIYLAFQNSKSKLVASSVTMNLMILRIINDIHTITVSMVGTKIWPVWKTVLSVYQLILALPV